MKKSTKKSPRDINESKYKGEWIALDPKTKRVVSHSRSLRVAKQSAQKKGVKQPILYGVPKSDAYFVGSN